ncbi:DUF2490 domain-containing protein [Chondrinema litorale]|uniref:DUF2490 domain-containing protein n=1 Tax=Chondrinema litorale TaxID=2994555 RepID=UPI0025435A4F|nr:DUF2490 domain-containing protein [Chondrinema litorale]UZR95256.1 DUF2490 domain-containing protein [Chondrinema litorale]
MTMTLINLPPENTPKHQAYIKLPIAFMLLFLSFSSLAQVKTIETYHQQWFQYFNNIRFSERWSWLSDGGLFLEDRLQSKSMYILRTGIGYNLNPQVKFVLGVANLGFYNSECMNKIELRPYQEVSAKIAYGKVGTVHRFRLEHRFRKLVNQTELLDDETSFNFRFRYRIMFKIPLVNFSEDNPSKRLSLKIGDEIFLNAGKEVVTNVFDKNRIIVGPSMSFSKNLSVYFTYMHQLVSTSNVSNYNSYNVLWLGVMHNINLMDKHKKS